MSELVRVAAGQTDGSAHWVVYLLFVIAGLLVGGTWAAYQAENRVMTFIGALAAAVAFAAALLWLLGEVG